MSNSPANICSMLRKQNMQRVIHRLECIEMLYDKLSIYKYIQDNLQQCDVSNDANYQKAFKNFYRVRRNNKWRKDFFSILEQEKNNQEIRFDNILCQVYRKSGKVETSYCSKLVATIDPNRPVWDTFVLNHLKLLKPSYNPKRQKQIANCCNVYLQIEQWMTKSINQQCFKQWVLLFDQSFPQFICFTDIKKLDLFLWQYR